ALRQPVAPILARELNPKLFEPVNRTGRLTRQHLDEPPVGGLMRAFPDVVRMLVGRVVDAESGLDPALRLRRVAGLHRSFGGERHACTRAMGRDGRRKPGRAASDHEYVDKHGRSHGGQESTTEILIVDISQTYRYQGFSPRGR